MDERHTWDDARLLADSEHPDATFIAFYRRHATSVLAFYARRNVDASRAAELTAGVFATALRGRYGVGATRQTAAPWLHALACAELTRDAGAGGRLRRALRARRTPHVELDLRDRVEYATLAFGPFDVLDVLAERPRARRPAPRTWRAHRTEDARG